MTKINVPNKIADKFGKEEGSIFIIQFAFEK